MKRSVHLKVPQDHLAENVARHLEDRALNGEISSRVVDHPPHRAAPALNRRMPQAQQTPASTRGRVVVGPSRPPRPAPNAARQGTQRPKKKDEFLPPRGQPGGLDDPNRRNLCGSRVKWYLRYLQQGLTPDVALKKATEPREASTAPAPAPKRRSSTLTPSVATPKRVCPVVKGATRGSVAMKVAEGLDLRPSTSRAAAMKPSSPTSTEPRLSYADMAKKLKVAVLPVEFPYVMLSHGDLSVLEETIIDEVIASGGDIAVSFASIHFRVGFLVIECSDEASADWLRTVASRLQSWKGVPLECKVGDDIPSPHCITLFCPRSVDRTTESLLVLLQNQNGIKTDTWKVISRRNEGGGALLVIGIDELSKNIIVEKGHQIFFRYGTIPVSRLIRRVGAKPQPAPMGKEIVKVDILTTSDTLVTEQSSHPAQPADLSDGLVEDEELAEVPLGQEEILGDVDNFMSSQELAEQLQDAAVTDVDMTSSGDGGNSRPQSP
ncbi:uncharacterized protein LOC116805988 [Drosophila grimshawi]|uniref:uncharacterized protein LOC116805988 n=1 Tax=Drosophila grimshawi TaxID=7222 RepID=UPI001C931FC9|nr:uncharacterized protein LOC116805988 [Drosophila grimshawi]XP_043070872.1 uncharacterized protein LOC116805988 [Drosophila grimshawi]